MTDVKFKEIVEESGAWIVGWALFDLGGMDATPEPYTPQQLRDVIARRKAEAEKAAAVGG